MKIVSLIFVLNCLKIGIGVYLNNELKQFTMSEEVENFTTVKLQWIDQKTTNAILNRVNENFCCYKGSFQEERNSLIFVTGCFEDEIREIQIHSKIFGDFVGTSHKNGTVQRFEQNFNSIGKTNDLYLLCFPSKTVLLESGTQNPTPP